MSKQMTDENSSDISAPPSPNRKQADIKQILESVDDALKQNWSETEGSDNNVLIEETQDTVDFSIKPKIKKADTLTSKVEQRRSKSPINKDGSLVINHPLEQVKVALLGKSSSPIVPRRRTLSYRKSKSPVPRDGDSSSEKVGPRRSLRSKSRSPLPDAQEHEATESHPKLTDTKTPRAMCDLEEDIADLDSSDSNTELSTKSTRSKSKDIVPTRDSIIGSTDKLITKRSLRSKSKSPSLHVQENEVTDSQSNMGSNYQSPRLHHKEMEKPRNLLNSKSDTNTKSESLSLSNTPKSYMKEDNVEKSKLDNSESGIFPLEAASLEQSFEKPKETEEIIVTNDRKSKNESEIQEEEKESEDEETSINNLPDSLTTKASNAAESRLDESDFGCTASEQTNIQDKTEYHTAVGTTNNESDFNSILSTDIEVTQSGVKDESTHYLFELDSDEDDVPHSEDTSKVAKIETSIIDRRIMAMQKELNNQNNDDAAVKKSHKRNSHSPENEHRKIKVLTGTETGQLPQKVPKSIDDIEIVEDATRDSIRKNNKSEDDGSRPSSNQSIIENSTGTDNEKCETNNLKRKSSELALISTNVEEASKSNSPTFKKCKDSSIVIGCDNEKVKVSEQNMVKENISTGSPKEKEKTNIQEIIVALNPDMQEHNDKKKSPNKNQDNSEKSITRGRKSIEKKIKSKLNESGESEEACAETVNEEAKKDIGEKSHKNDSDQNIAISDDILKRNKSEDQKTEKSSRANKSLNKSVELGKTSPDDLSTVESVEDVSFCKMADKKVLTTKLENKTSINKELKLRDDSKSPKKKPTLDEFASSKLEKYLDPKAEEIEGSSSDEAEEEESGEEESGEEYNGFIDGMAEEGEEDTPSEDSNQIIDEGESVGFSSDEEINTDDDYENDSFICDDDDEPELLLSGDEYDLGSEVKQKKNKNSRIIDPSTLGDEDIIKVPEKKKVETKNPIKKRSRIIRVTDSSEEDEENDARKVEKDQSIDGSIILIEDSNNEEASKTRMMGESKNNEPIVIEESKIENTSEAIISVEESKMVESSDQLLIDESSTKDLNHHSIIVDDSNNSSNHHNTSLGNLNTSLQKRHRKSSLTIQENILIDGKKDPSITKRINTLVESFCSTVKKGEIALNLSLEYEDVDSTNQDNYKTETVHVLSDIKICPNKPSASQEKQQPEFTDSSENPDEKHEKLSTSLEDSADLREGIVTKQSRKRLSKSLDDLNEDTMKSKRRKKHKNKKSKQKTDSEESLSKATTSRSKKQDKSDTDPTVELRNAISSFSIMNQLITDVKNRPRRVMKPTKSDIEAESSWTTTKVSNLKPSTSPVTKHEKMKIPPKLHPKDFKNQMLFSDSRVKRIDTKTLLKKKGAYY